MKRCVLCVITILLLMAASVSAETEVIIATADLSAENASLVFFDRVEYGNYDTPKTVTIEENTFWELDKSDKNGYFIGFNLSDSFANKVSDGSEFAIEIDYYDGGSGFFNIIYDSQKRDGRICKPVAVSDSKNVKTAVFTLDDAYFGGRVYGEYDFVLTIESPRYYQNEVSGYSLPVCEVRVEKSVAKNKITHYGYTEESGNIFSVYSAKKTLYNEFKNTTNEKLSAEVSYTAVGSDGKIYREIRENIVLEAGETKKSCVDMKLDRCDLYTLYIHIANNEKKIDINYKRYNFAVVKTDPWGIKNENYYLAAHFQHYGANTDDGLDVVAKSNTYGVRAEFGWTHVYNSADRKSNIYKEEDMLFHNKLREKDLHLLAIYGFSVTAETGGWKYLPVSESALESWEQGIEFAAKNTKDIVERIEIWNEPDILAFNGGEDYKGAVNEFGVKNSPEEYAEAAKRAYAGAKKGNPEVEVGVMSLVELRKANRLDFFRRAMIDADLQNFCDGVTFHPYSDGSAEHYHNMGNYEKNFLQLLDADKKLKVWNTEYGFSTVDNASMTDIKQARHMVRTPIHLMGEGVGDVNVGYNFAQKGLVSTNREDNFGIVGPGFEGGDSEFDKNFVPRQAYVAVAAMNYYMAQAEPDGMGNYGTEVPDDARNEHDSEHIYKFISHKFDADIYVMWRTEKETEKELWIGAKSVILADMFGNEETLYSEDGKYTFNIGYSPQYVIVKNNQGAAFSVDEIEYMQRKDGKWVEAGSLEENEVTVRVTGYNPEKETETVNIVIACYRDKNGVPRLEKAEVIPVTVSAENVLCYEKKFKTDEYDAIKCTVWDAGKMIPYTMCKALK